MIRVGITEFHGIAQEYVKNPPKGVVYSPVKSNDIVTKYIFNSSAKGVYSYVKSKEHDIIEAPLFPIITSQPWVYTPAHYSSAGAFNVMGIPTPRILKLTISRLLLGRSNLHKILFKSQFGLESLHNYGGKISQTLLNKAEVVYPVVREVSDSEIKYSSEVKELLFVGEFFRKGGANVVDAFLMLKKEYPQLKLTICGSKNFKINSDNFASRYLKIIENDPDITIKLVARDELMSEIIPRSDIYFCPTYQEAWGFSIQEAMAFGKPIIASDISAIPEMITDMKNGLLANIKNCDYIKNSKGYIVNEPDDAFMQYLTNDLYVKAKLLIEDFDLRKRVGLAALSTAREKFSPQARNLKMLKIYQDALR